MHNAVIDEHIDTAVVGGSFSILGVVRFGDLRLYPVAAQGPTVAVGRGISRLDMAHAPPPQGQGVGMGLTPRTRSWGHEYFRTFGVTTVILGTVSPF